MFAIVVGPSRLAVLRFSIVTDLLIVGGRRKISSEVDSTIQTGCPACSGCRIWRYNLKLLKNTTAIVASVLLSLAGSAAQAQSGSELNLVRAGEFEDSQNGRSPSNVIDGSTNQESRWSSKGESRNVWVDLGSVQRVTEVAVAWGFGDDKRYDFEIRAHTSLNGSWDKVYRGESKGNTTKLEQYNVDNVDARYIRIKVFENDYNNWQSITEIKVYGDTGNSAQPVAVADNAPTGSSAGSGQFGLDPNAEPWENFDLTDWAIDTPAFASDGESERFGEFDWNDISKDSENFFFTHTDGGMRFVTRLDGAKTSKNTSYVRSELREMLRRGNEKISTRGANGNNWALGYQPGNTDHAGRNGKLSATLRVNKVTTTGDDEYHLGRTIIGQIHAEEDEPLKLYYRKFPGDSRGCIYIRMEVRKSDDIRFPIVGDEDCNSPSNGIALNELFSYEITNDDEDITVRIRRGDRNGPTIGLRTIDLDKLDAGYDLSSEWMYFKLGAYTQNNTGNKSDGDIITFYRLENTHDKN